MRRTVLLLASTALAVLLASGVAFAAPASFDASFDGDGKVITDFSPPEDPRDEWAEDVIVQPDGKLVTVGYAQTGSYTDFALARYNADGSLDTAFGTGGKVTTDLVAADQDDYANAAVLQSDGKIVVAGYTSRNSTEQFALVRYNADGTLDGTFDGDGKLISYITSRDDYASDLEVLDNGKIVVAGSANDNAALAKYNADGTLDTSFGTGGKTLHGDSGGYFDTYDDLAIQPDGKIVAQAGYWFSIARHDPDGSLDPSLQADRSVGGYTGALAIQPDGKIVQAGSIEDNNGFSNFALVRRMGDFQDITKPSGSVAIDGGRRVTKDRTVTLSLDATDPSPGSGVDKMRIKNAGASWSSWTRYVESKDWRITRKAGTKTVYVQYRDAADNISSTAKDTITYKP